MTTPRTIVAAVQLIPTSEGGRTSPLVSGYRSVLRFSESADLFGFQLDLVEQKTLGPGESGIARLSFWAVEELPELSAGDTFEIAEGWKPIGHGAVIESGPSN